jgi:hypothetical protein
MNRRDFNIRLAALGATPLAPALPATAATAPATLSGKALMHYPWAARYARVHDACSPDRLARVFRLAPETAGQIFAKLQADGVISAPGLTGIARATNPINLDLQFSPSTAQSTRTALSKRLKKALSEKRETVVSEADEPPVKAATETELSPTPEDPPTD